MRKHKLCIYRRKQRESSYFTVRRQRERKNCTKTPCNRWKCRPSNSKHTKQQERATQSNNDADADHPNLFHGVVTALDLCNSDIEVDGKRYEQNALETSPLENCTERNTKREINVVQETPEIQGDVDEYVLMEVEDTPQEETSAQDIVQLIGDFDESIHLNMDDTPRNQNAIQKTPRKLKEVDENVLLDVKGTRQEGKSAQETEHAVENPNRNIHLSLEDTPRYGNVAQGTSQTIEDIDEGILLEEKDNPQERKSVQEIVHLVDDHCGDIHLGLEDIPQDRNVIQNTARTFEGIDELEVENTQQEEKSSPDIVQLIEDCDANIHLNLNDIPREENAIQKTPRTLEEVDENVPLKVKVTAQEEKSVQETEYIVENLDANIHLSLGDTSRAENAIQETLDEIDKNVLLIVKDTPQEGGNVKQETPWRVDNIDETILFRVTDTPEDGKGAHETVHILENLDENAHLRFVDTPRDENVIQKTQKTSARLDENLLLEVENVQQEGRDSQEIVQLIEDCDENIHLNLNYAPRDENAIQITQRKPEVVDENVLLEVERIPQDGKGVQETVQIVQNIDTNIHLMLKNTPRGGNVAQETPRIDEDIDENIPFGATDTLQEGKSAQETVHMVENLDGNIHLSLEDTPRYGNVAQGSSRTIEDKDENILLEEKVTLQEGKSVQETVHLVDNHDGDWGLEDIPRDRNAMHKTPRTFEDLDENVLLEVENTQQGEKGSQGIVQFIEDCDANIHFNSNDIPRDENAIQKTPRSLEEVDENVLLEMEGIPQEGKCVQETAHLLENLDENIRLKLEDTPPDGNVIQRAPRTFGDVDVNFRLMREDRPILQERECTVEEITRIFGEFYKNIDLDLDDTLEVFDDNVLLELEATSRQATGESEIARTLEDFDEHVRFKLGDTSLQGKLKYTSIVHTVLEEVDATKVLDSTENLSEKPMEEDTSIKCTEDDAADNYLVLEEPNVVALDDSDIGTTSKYALKSPSFEIKENTSSKEMDRQLLFEWLSCQEGVTCYYYKCNEIVIHVRRSSTVVSTIAKFINNEFQTLRDNYRIEYSDPGASVPCVRPTCLTERGEPVLGPSDEEIIYPGKEISCRSFGSGFAKYGTFSGKICGNGISAGHITLSESELVHTSAICYESQVIGTPILPIEWVRVPIPGTQAARKTLADLLFFLINNQDSVNNLFYGDPFNSGRPELFDIVLHRGSVKEGDEVMVILRHEKVVFGRIRYVDFNDATVKNTLYIVDTNNRAVTADGDSGAIVVLRPYPGDRNLKAIGVVTHVHRRLKPEFEGTNYTELNAENSISLGTISINLYEVLVAIQQGATLGVPPEFRKVYLGPLPVCIEFSGPLAARQEFDSGIQAAG